MRHPQFYASNLRRVAERVRESMREHDREQTIHNARFARRLDNLALEWQMVANRAGALKGETFTVLSREIDEWPWAVGAHPEVEGLLKNMLENDVT